MTDKFTFIVDFDTPNHNLKEIYNYELTYKLKFL